MENIQKKLIQIKATIANAENKYGRAAGSVLLVAVSKGQPIEKIKTAIIQRQIHFGESYLQEALIKIKELEGLDIIWHYIGRIQSKKAKLIAQNFSWIETVTSYKVAELLDKHRPANLPPLNVCIQINLSNEINKGGVLREEILPLAKKISQLPRLKLRGLMAIPNHFKEFDKQLKSFDEICAEFKKLQNQGFDIDTLSIGMSNDLEAAIAAGATTIRIGTDMFGKRTNNN